MSALKELNDSSLKECLGRCPCVCSECMGF
uniref:Uncharacterized protein n=1 Tax=Arundo donax TaxID=35708 RepID=A0A0A8XZA5_ARUDO